ncbi:CaiB/BaiF CoA transferase family protein [Bacillus testis]|uniref:CaiB/BaiF CoA transferase family protein n=1 Tax=Bacillus testis TaxID=1622072 RepID=UPI00067F0B30|nr:CoA transferase [Bacillus testis]
MSTLPLEGIRILDLSMWWSGPLCTSFLGAQGAEVIKVESVQSPDGFRYTLSVPGDHWWELGPQFVSANHNKKGITLNLNDEEGLTLFKELVAKSDVVIENFTPRVMKNFGLTYDVLKEINPEIIMFSMPAYGNEGPYKDQPGFAFTFEMLSGIAQLNGYKDENPMIVAGVADVISGFHTTFAVLAALEYRNRTGKGQFVEVPQVESCVNLMGQPISDVSLNGRSWGRNGNRQPNYAPHGAYRSKGNNSWIAIAVSTEEEWTKFKEAIGNPDWASRDEFSTFQKRYAHQDELDSLIESWTSALEHYEAANLLQEAGISAGPVLHVNEMEKDPYLADLFQELDRKYVGKHAYPSWPLKVSGERLKHRFPAPTIGEHNEEVLKHLLGLSDEKIGDLENKGIIGSEPQSQ